jgi:hypothetical protein
MEPQTKNDCAGEGQQQITTLPPLANVSPRRVPGPDWLLLAKKFETFLWGLLFIYLGTI